MRRLSGLFLAAVSFAAASCVGEVLRGPGEIAVDRSDFVPVEFNAVMEQLAPETKTVMDGDVEDKLRDLLWEPGDEVLLTSSYSSPFGILKNIESAPSAAATFKGSYSNGYSSFTAVYPASIVDTTKVYVPTWEYAEANGISTSYIYIDLPSEQKYFENGVASGALPMAAYYSNGNSSMTFKSLCAVLVLKLRSDVEGLRVNSIRVRGRSDSYSYGPMSGTYRISRWNSDPYMSDFQEDKKNEYVDLDCVGDNGEGVDINKAEPVYFHVVIPYRSYYGFELELHTNRGRAVASSKSDWVNIEKGKRYLTASTVPLEFVIDDLSFEETANSYIVPEIGQYKFKATVKGNSTETINPKSATVLWESYGKGAAPKTGDIISDVSLEDGYIHFTALRQGNAVIAAVDDAQKVLWSWHIWSTDGYDPVATQEVYNNKAGIFMDRNLGAMSSLAGDPGAKGLYYQWGRKDPFTPAASTLSDWPSRTSSAESGTVAYSVANPTTFIYGNDANYDWYYTGSSDTDNTRWDSAKSMYDPCPVGWKVPAAVWSAAMGAESANAPELWDSGDAGMNLAGKFGGENAWYPGAGAMDYQQKGMYKENEAGYYWSSTPSSEMAASLLVNKNGSINTMYSGVRSYGMSVRCCRSDFSLPVDASGASDLSKSESANSYIVTEHAKQYKFKSTKKGNSSEDIGGEAYKVEVVWESLGTDETPAKGDVVANVGLSGDGYIVFTSGSKDGNALVALKDMNNNILWSWHIWSVEGYDALASSQQYRNSAIMMDRNLGALIEVPSESVDDTRDDGLLYQWGRKDPFLGANASNERIASTLEWPSAVPSSVEIGTVDYSIAHPTTVVNGNGYGTGWLYCSDANNIDNSLWGEVKTKYDPCPPGWVVPKGGSDGVWASAFYTDQHVNVNSQNLDYGRNSADFGEFFGTGTSTWYPMTYYISDGSLYGRNIFVTSSTPYDDSFNDWNRRFTKKLSAGYGWINTSENSSRSDAISVRCAKEYSMPAPRTHTSLSSKESANSYIVPDKGKRYSFNGKVRGNGSDSQRSRIDEARWAEVLWESNGTEGATKTGDVIKDVEFKRGEVRFTSAGDGNALIALRDYNGKICWSWHVWVSSGYDPEASGQVYGNAGMMMDRNLGAMSAAAGDAKSYGLLYQWGRKDPFLGSAGPDGSKSVSSSVEWPSPVDASTTNYVYDDNTQYGSAWYSSSLDYSFGHPMTFIAQAEGSDDWYYVHDGGGFSGVMDNMDRKWNRGKTIFDPCPPGWRVADGGDASLWAADGVSFGAYDSVNKGYSVNSSFWYPMVPVRGESDGALNASSGSTYWASPLADGNPYYLQLSETGVEVNGKTVSKGRAGSVRCCKIGFVPEPESDTAVNLSKKGTANSYIANDTGTTYQFYAKVQGNSDKSVPGTPAKAGVVWESFGTKEKPNAGDVVSDIKYSKGYISFKAGKDGNAVIAVMDESDNILWSWHIWVCNGYDPDATAHVYNNGAGTFMDRNLGALSATPGEKTTDGLFYQWGRKDPFIDFNNSETSDSYVGYTASAGMSFGTVYADADHWSDYSFANPMSFISGYMDNNKRKWTIQKSEYDPCPPGWHVPARSMEDHDANPFSVASGYTSVSGSSYWSDENRGWSFGPLLSEGNDVWYPSAGYIESNGYINQYHWVGALWLSAGDTSSSYQPYIDMWGGGNWLYFNSTSDTSRGYAVRCVKE